MTIFERDFDALAVGERFVSEGRRIEESDILAFATLTGDTHPQHVDPAWAESSRFGEQIAHGLLVLSCASGSSESARSSCVCSTSALVAPTQARFS